jgi:hypothetical protein
MTSRVAISVASLSLLSLGASACKARDTARSPDAAPSSPASEPLDAAGGAGSAADAERWYPEGKAQALKLTWAVYPSIAEGEAGPKRPIEVIARIGNATKRLKLGTHEGYLHPDEQSLCAPSLKSGNVASLLKLNTMGPKTLFAKRTSPDKIEVSFHVDADPEENGALGTIPIPADATISEAISDIQSAQDEAPFDCQDKVSDGGPKETAPIAVSPSAKRIDTSDWKSAPAGSKLTATWTVDQSRATPRIVGKLDDVKDRSKVTVPVQLQLSLGGRSHAVDATGSAGVPGAEPCGELTFFWADARVELELKRAAGGKVVLLRKEDFPTLKTQQLFVFDVPNDVQVAQSIIVIDPQRTRTTNAKCRPAKL